MGSQCCFQKTNIKIQKLKQHNNQNQQNNKCNNSKQQRIYSNIQIEIQKIFQSTQNENNNLSKDYEILKLTNQLSNVIQEFENLNGQISQINNIGNLVKKSQHKIKQIINNISQVKQIKKIQKSQSQQIIEISDTDESFSIQSLTQEQFIQDKQTQNLFKFFNNQCILDIQHLEINKKIIINGVQYIQNCILPQYFQTNQNNIKFQIVNLSKINTQIQFHSQNQFIKSVIFSICYYYQFFKIILFGLDICNQNIIPLPVVNSYYLSISINGSRLKLIINFNQLSIKQNDHYTICNQGKIDLWPLIIQLGIKKIYRNNINELTVNPSIEIYHLTGWSGQYIFLSEISNFDNLWLRLKQNFLEGNIIVNFQNQNFNYFTLIDIHQSQDKKIIKLRSSQNQFILKCQHIDFFQSQNNINLSLFWLCWQQALAYFTKVYVNWNYNIYPYKRTINGKWNKSSSKSMFNNPQFSIYNFPQYLLRIPPHFQEFELRICLDLHFGQKNINKKSHECKVQLFQYHGQRIVFPNEYLKKLQESNREIISDVLIFESSQQFDYFILSLIFEQQTECQNYTMHIYSFCEVDINLMNFRIVSKQLQIKGQIKTSNIGGGLNSPFFLNNYKYQLIIHSNIKLQIRVESNKQNVFFQLILIQDNQKKKDITLLSYQKILNENISQQNFSKGIGFLQVNLKQNNYLLVIAVLSIQNFKYIITFRQMKDKITENQYLCHSQKQNFQVHKIITQVKKNITQKFFQWTIHNSKGPRLRYKTTITQKYHPILIFKDFFINPSFRFKAIKGNYQFNIQSIDFNNQYKKKQNKFIKINQQIQRIINN